MRCASLSTYSKHCCRVGALGVCVSKITMRRFLLKSSLCADSCRLSHWRGGSLPWGTYSTVSSHNPHLRLSMPSAQTTARLPRRQGSVLQLTVRKERSVCTAKHSRHSRLPQLGAKATAKVHQLTARRDKPVPRQQRFVGITWRARVRLCPGACV